MFYHSCRSNSTFPFFFEVLKWLIQIYSILIELIHIEGNLFDSFFKYILSVTKRRCIWKYTFYENYSFIYICMFIIMRSSTIRTGKGNGLRNVITSDTQPRKAKANLNSHMMSCSVGKWLETYLRSHNMYRTLSNILKNRRKWKNIWWKIGASKELS